MATRRDCRDASPRERRPPAVLPGSPPPVLILSHFCPKPFLCFGDVRPGASRTLPLALLNPNAEAAAVTLPRGPAAACGFHVWPRAFELQPKEKMVISVNWTPVKEGRVREILTFLVNDILKHEVILLGNAEEPKRKKRSLWDAINKKKAVPSTSHKRTSNIQNVNKTFNVSQKVDRIRSPLQACENLGRSEGCSPTENNYLILEENKIPISPIGPMSTGCCGETRPPHCVHQPTTSSPPRVPENGELWHLEGASLSSDFSEKVVPDPSVNSVNSVSGHIEEDSKLIFTPNCSSTLNITQNQGNFLSPDSFVKNSQAANNEPELVSRISSDTFLKDNSMPVYLESKAVHEIYQTILSPDSFIKDNYGLNQALDSKLVNSTLSPNQFVKDNMTYISISQHTCKLSPLSKEISQVSQSPQRKNEVLPCVPECQGSNSPKAFFEDPKASDMKPNCYGFTKQNQPKFSAVQDISGYRHNSPPKRRPILSATVTKLNPSGTRENRTKACEPKARRCLHSVAGRCENITDNLEGKESLPLPIINPVESRSYSCRTVTMPSSKTTFMARKRKSEGNREDASVIITVTEPTEVQEIKGIHFFPAELKTSTAKKTKKVVTPISKRISDREKRDPKKKTDSLAYKTPNAKTNKRTKRIVPVAQSNLTFIKPLKTDIPRHPMPFAAKNMFYDERWKEKQEQGFTWWLNFVLTPDDFTVRAGVSEVNAASLLLGAEGQYKVSVPRAPTKDEASLRAYTARCRLNRLRRAACRLFTSERMVKATKKLEIEIEARRLVVRKDRHLWKDVGERQKVLNWLLSYHPLWLRIGLETVYGELLALEDNSDVTGMAVFILSRLLWNPDVAAEYRHPSVPHLYRDGHEEALSKFTLKKLLLLVCFLDYAKASRLIDHDPCLFCKDAEFKTSKEILLAFSRDFLSGEGDLSRHLSLLGFPVTHAQTPLDEFDFAVTNLAVDLHCGVRLVRTMELLTRNWDLSKKLRIPAISRLQKLHNVDIVLQILKSRGIALTDEHGSAILSKDIVDRHREKTLALLWKIVLAFQVDISLNLDQLKEEIHFLKHTWRTRKATRALSGHPDAVLRRKADVRPSGPSEPQSGSVTLLMEWVNAVCAFYNKTVENFTVSFSDGRVLCYLIHHYHPSYVPLGAICQRTTQTVECAQTGSVVLNSSTESDESFLDVSLKALSHENTSELHKELLENERKNFQLVRSAVRDLGGIPAMIHHSDMSNTIPDEKVVITYLSFLCARLLDLRREARAALLIQTTWRKYKLKVDLRHHQERDKAARIIQSAIINFLMKQRLKKICAALVIQKYWRRRLQQRNLLVLEKENLEKIQSKAASVIQRYWRSYSTRKEFLKLKKCSIALQSRIRRLIAVASYKRYLWAAITIQRHWRARMSRKRDLQSSKLLQSSRVRIQPVFRQWRPHKMQLWREAAETPQRAFGEQPRALEAGSATLIQAWYRMHRALRKYTHIRACVVLIQARFRGVQARKAYRQKREAVLTLQRRWRAWLQGRRRRSHYLRTRAAALRLQAAFRARRAQRAGAARVLQAYWRMRRERFRFLSLRKTVIKLQAHVRGHQQLRKYRKTKEATLVIQIHFRAYLAAKAARAAYWEVRTAVVVVQAMWRGRRARERLHRARTSIIRIQSCYRAYINRKRFLSLKHATVKLQSVVRMKRTREYYLRLRAAALFTQRRYQSLRMVAIARGEYRCLRGSCVRLQALVRGYLVRKQLNLRRGAAVALQAHFKMRKVRQDYLKMREAALVIQGAYRAHRVRVRRAATCLQAAYRGYRARRLLQQQCSAALTLQAAFRGLCQRRKYRSVLRSVVRIQRWYRALRVARGLRMQFLKTRAAILSLQAAYRGWQVREQVRRERRAAVTLQSAVRMAQARRQFLLLKTAALVIQRRRRALAAGRKQRVAYVELRLAALTLQSAWKRRAARRQAAAVVIQSYCRMYVQHERWRVVRKAACLIQRYYRAYSLGRKQQLLYRKTKAAVVTLQAAYRRMRVRRTAQERSRAAVTIQSSFRAHRARKRYAALRAAAVAIQRWYRSVKIADRQRKEYLALKKAAAKIQAVRRGLRARRHIQHMHKAATLIKAVFKMHQSKMRYRKMRAAAVIIQVRFRAYRRGKTQRAQYLAILEAVTVLQASFRGARVRQALRAMWTAATQIQSCYRGHRERARFRELRKATETVQRRFRAVRARDVHVQRYRRLRCAAVRIQAVFRGVRARRHVQAMHSAATAIQRWFRAHTLRRRFLCLRKTVVWVQRKYCANICAKHHLEFLQLQKAVIRIQSSFRSWVVRKRLQAMHRAATVIQATFRMHRARVRYRALKHASVFIQHGSMTQRALQLQREDFMGQRCPAATVQAARQGRRAGPLLRGGHRAAAGARSARGTFRPSFLHRKAWWATKGVQGKHRANKKKALQHRAGANAAACAQDMAAAEQRQEQRQAATSVQKHFKAFGTRKRFLHFRNTVVLAQRRSRALAAMRTHAACLQSSSTGVKVRRHLAATREILSFYGSCRARAHYHAETPAAGVAQKHCRSGVRAAMEKGQPLAVRESVQTAQAASRGRKVGPESETASREEMAVLADRPASLCASPRTPHRAARGSALRPRQGSHPLVAAVSQAQSQTAEATPEAFQKMTPRKEAQEDAALRVRASLLMAAWQRRRVEQRRAAVTLQLSFWCRRVRRQLLLLRGPALLAHGRHRAPRGRVSLRVRRIVVLIQARVRGFLQRRRFQKIKDSALKIQAVWRGYRVRKYVREVKAACKIQAWYRCQKARRECLATPRAVSATQGHCRTTLERAWFLKVKASTVIIQRKWRATVSGRRAREDFLTMKISEQRAKTRLLRFTAAAYCHLSALRIQRAYKRHVAVKTAEKHVGSVICIQRWFRRRLQLKRLVRVCHGIMSIRREARERRTQQGRAASVIQRAVRRFLLRKKRERLNNGAIKIQAWWRGCSWRRKNDCMKIKAIRTSLQIINGEVREENKLYRRTARALHHLLTYKHLSAILEALRHLEVVTRLSPLCCENMAESGAIPTILVLIRSCNRSVPCMEVISCAVQVLLNVAKYEKTAPAVYGADSCVHTLLELLQMYREKPGDRVADKSRSIFTRTCCLLAVLLRATSLASDVWDRSKVVDCVCSIYKLTARKHRLNADRTLHQHKSCAAVPSVPEAPVRPRPAARLKPDWALRRDSMGEIANPLQALQMVMDTLGTPS